MHTRILVLATLASLLLFAIPSSVAVVDPDEAQENVFIPPACSGFAPVTTSCKFTCPAWFSVVVSFTGTGSVTGTCPGASASCSPGIAGSCTDSGGFISPQGTGTCSGSGIGSFTCTTFCSICFCCPDTTGEMQRGALPRPAAWLA